MYSLTRRLRVAGGIGRIHPRVAWSTSSMLSPTVRSSMTPSARRFSLENASFSSMAWRGVRNRCFCERTSSSPPSAVSAPNSSLASSVRPEPRSPATPTTSPSKMFRSTASRAPLRLRFRTLSSGGPDSSTPLGGDLTVETLEDLELTADHHPDQLELRDVLGEAFTDELAVAKDREAIADLEDLVEEVRDEHDGDTLAAQGPHDLEQLGDLVGVQAGRGLVEDQDLAVHVDRAGDGHELLHRDRVLAQHRARVDVQRRAGPASSWRDGSWPCGGCRRGGGAPGPASCSRPR